MPVGVMVGVGVLVGEGVGVDVFVCVGVAVGVLVDVGVGVGVPVGVGVSVLVGVEVGVGNQLLKMRGRYVRKSTGGSASTLPAPSKSRRSNITTHPVCNCLLAALKKAAPSSATCCPSLIERSLLVDSSLRYSITLPPCGQISSTPNWQRSHGPSPWHGQRSHPHPGSAVLDPASPPDHQ